MKGLSARSLIDALPIVDENILVEAAKQPLLFIRASMYRVIKMRKRSQANAKGDYVRARLAMGIRGKKNQLGEKVTEGTLKEKVECDSSVRQLRKEVDLAFAEEEFAKLILEAMRMRRDAIRIIADAKVYEGGRETAEVERVDARRQLVEKARQLEHNRRSLRHKRRSLGIVDNDASLDDAVPY
jgi:hypothetical protein